MSLATNVAGSTLRPLPQQQQQHVKSQHTCSKTSHINNNSNSNSNHSITTLPQASFNCLQQSPPPQNAIKTSLSTSPIAANYVGSPSLFSFESNVVLSGSSGCCSLSNSPSSSSSSHSYLTSQSIENSCNKLLATSGNQLCLNASTSLEDSFQSVTCQLNSSLLAAVNCDLEDDHLLSQLVTDTSNQTETNLHTSETIQNHNDNNNNEHGIMLENMHNQHTQQSTAESTCLNNEDARTLQLAVELTMMNLNQMPSPTSKATITLSPTSKSNHFQQLQPHHMQHSTLEHQQPYSSSSTCTSICNPYHMTTKVFLQTQSQAAATLLNQKFLPESNQDNIPLSNPNQNLATVTPTTTDERSKKSQNMTECVPVPSSEHVAEIVGRQGCKIKALRAKTNTYIKTPVRNEEPVFVVTGRKEDVAKAKREILSAAEHFTLIRATRRSNDGNNACSAGINGNSSGGHLVQLNKNPLSSAVPLPGQITIQVRVPYRVVGLVVGPKGNTIKHIQHETQTYIVTPSRDKEPIFEVTGMPDNVQLAKKQIESHIATRTGNSLAIPAPPPPPPPPPAPAPAGALNRLNKTLPLNQTTSFHSLNILNQMLNDDLHSELLSSIYKNGIGSALEYNQIDGSILNSGNKCNTSNILNSFVNNAVSPSISSVSDMQRQMTQNIGASTNSIMQLNCNDFINNIMDSNAANTANQFVNEQNTNFNQMTNNNAIGNYKSVINTINLMENSNNSSSGHLHQQSNLTTNTLLTRSCSSASSTASSSKSFNNSGNNNTAQFWKSLNAGSLVNNGTYSGSVNNDNVEIDEGIGESPLYSWGLHNTLAALTNSYCSPTSTSISPTDSLLGDNTNNKTAILQQQQLKASSKTRLIEKLKRKNCWMCHEKDIVATLIPCGHTIFCYLCANRLCQQNDASCPVCSTQIYQAIRVH